MNTLLYVLLGIVILVMALWTVANAIHDIQWDSFNKGYNEGYKDGRNSARHDAGQ